MLDKISDILVKPVNYFDFPNTILAFAHSMKSSKLMIVNDSFIFRRYGITATLITYRCKDVDVFQRTMKNVTDKFKVKILNSKYSMFPADMKKSYGKEWYTNNKYSIKNLSLTESHKHVKKKIRSLARADDTFYIDNHLSYDEWISLFDQWYEGAKKRHFMVIKGHYLSYMDDYFKYHITKVIPFRFKETGELFGVCGYEAFSGKAQITIMKHKFGYNNFPLYFWFNSIQKIFKDNDIKILYCGSTADQLKGKTLGLSYYKSYKLK